MARSAFAAIRSDGSVVTWGSAEGALACQSLEVHAQVAGTAAVFIATSQTRLSVCMPPTRQAPFMLVCEKLLCLILESLQAFAALRADGSVVTWGSASEGGDSRLVRAELSSGVEMVQACRQAAANACVLSHLMKPKLALERFVPREEPSVL
eukprot:6479636-Amphidinium_carterae.2